MLVIRAAVRPTLFPHAKKRRIARDDAVGLAVTNDSKSV